MMKIETLFSEPEGDGFVVTKITEAVKDKNRVNVFLDETFFCSLDISQMADLNLKVGVRLTDEEKEKLKRASDFGKLYVRSLEYVLLRPRSTKEVKDYLRKKTFDRRVRIKNHKTGEYQTVLKKGFDESLILPVMERLTARGYIDDLRFARTWVENRNAGKGISLRKLAIELRQKGVESKMIEEVLNETTRNDAEEILKIIRKKRRKYNDDQMRVYLVRQGFNYDDIQDALSSESLEA